jgi:hypothetical protein
MLLEAFVRDIGPHNGRWNLCPRLNRTSLSAPVPQGRSGIPYNVMKHPFSTRLLHTIRQHSGATGGLYPNHPMGNKPFPAPRLLTCSFAPPSLRRAQNSALLTCYPRAKLWLRPLIQPTPRRHRPQTANMRAKACLP